MSRSSIASFVGLVLGLTAAFGTVGDFVIVLLFDAVGLVVGMVLDGTVDLPALAGRAPEEVTPSTTDVRRRGVTVIADEVFEKIAGQAASEVAANAAGPVGSSASGRQPTPTPTQDRRHPLGRLSRPGRRPRLDPHRDPESMQFELAPSEVARAQPA